MDLKKANSLTNNLKAEKNHMPGFVIQTMQKDLEKVLEKEKAIPPLPSQPEKLGAPPEKLPVVPPLKPSPPSKPPISAKPPIPKTPIPPEKEIVKDEIKILLKEVRSLYKKKLYLEAIEKLEKILPLKISWWTKWKIKRYLKKCRQQIIKLEKKRQAAQRKLEAKLRAAQEERIRKEQKEQEKRLKAQKKLEQKLAAERKKAEKMAQKEAEEKRKRERMEEIRKEKERKRLEAIKVAEEAKRLLEEAKLRAAEEERIRKEQIRKIAEEERLRRLAEKEKAEIPPKPTPSPMPEKPPVPPVVKLPEKQPPIIKPLEKPIPVPPTVEIPAGPPLVKAKKLKLTPLLALISIIILIGLGGLIYWLNYTRRPVSPITPPPPEEIIELIPPTPLISTETTETISIKKGEEQTLADQLEKIAEKDFAPGSFKRILIKLTNQKQKYFSLAELFAALNIQTPLLNILEKDYTLFLYNQKDLSDSPFSIGLGRTRLGIVMTIKDVTEAKNLMLLWEKTMEKDLMPFFLKKKFSSAATPEFQDNIYKNISIRYLNFPDKYLTIDYAIINNKLLISTSQESIYAAIDRLLD